MSRKVLFLTALRNGRQYAGSAHEASLVEGCKRLTAASKGEPTFYTAAINELAIRIVDGAVSIKDLRNECDLKDYSYVYFRGVRLARDHFMAVARYLEHHGAAYADAQDVQGAPFGKIGQMVLFALNGVPVPDTLAVWSGQTYVTLVKQVFPLPLILKANDGIRGQDNYLVKDWKTFEELVSVHGAAGYVVQPFIPNDGDYRVLYYGGRRLVFRRKGASGTHLNNTSQGGKGELAIEGSYDPSVGEVAERAIEIFGREYGGADILVDRNTNKPYILEVNIDPAVLAGAFQREKADMYVAFIKEKIQE